jgi:exosortase/archaeosortase family protein
VSEAALPARAGGAHRRATPAGRPASRRSRERVRRPARPPERRSLPAKAVRLAASAGLALAAYVVVLENERIRDFEAWLSGHIITIAAGLNAGHGTAPPTVWFPTKTAEIGLVITPECTAALLAVPFIGASALLVWQRVPLARPLIGLGIALVSLIMVNQVRLLGIVLFVKAMGFSTGFYWGHTLVGSIITIMGLAGSLAMFAMVAVRRREKHPLR